MSYLSEEVVSAHQVPVPHLHAEQAVGQSVVQLELETLVPAWIARLLHHLHSHSVV